MNIIIFSFLITLLFPQTHLEILISSPLMSCIEVSMLAILRLSAITQVLTMCQEPGISYLL